MNEAVSQSGLPQNGPQRIRIIVAEDHPIMREALTTLLDKQADLEVVGEASDGEEAVRLVVELAPDVVLMDITMPKLNGLEATRQIKETYPKTAVLVLTVHTDIQQILGILEAGAAGYLSKSVFGQEVAHAIRGVVAGETVLSPSVFQQLMKQTRRHMIKPVILDAAERLTCRELQVLRLVATGMSNKAIALELELSLRTVKGYLADIFTKLNVSSRTEAIAMGLRAGFLTIDDVHQG